MSLASDSKWCDAKVAAPYTGTISAPETRDRIATTMLIATRSLSRPAPILVLAEQSDARGRKPVHDPRHMLDAIFYVARTGCQWRMLPRDFPPWKAVWSRFRRLRDNGLLERLYDALHSLWRRAVNRNEQPTAGIIDSQTVKSTEKGGLLDMTLARRSKAANAI